MASDKQNLTSSKGNILMGEAQKLFKGKNFSTQWREHKRKLSKFMNHPKFILPIIQFSLHKIFISPPLETSENIWFSIKFSCLF